MSCMSFERSVAFEPGHDCIRFECVNGSPDCKPGAGGSHGIHGMQIRWILKGEKGAVQFLLFAGWLPEPTQLDFSKVRPAMPADLGYHAREPHYAGHSSTKCDLLGAECYSDGSGLNAHEPFRILCNEGGEALWEFLESYYHCVFEGAEFPKGKPYKHAGRRG